MVEGKIMAGFVSPEYPVGLMGRWGRYWNGPESIVHATACDDDMVILDDFDIVLGEECCAVVIAELSKRDKCASLQIVKNKSSLGSG